MCENKMDPMDLREAQPSPTPGGVEIPPVLINFIATLELPEQTKKDAITLVHARDALGKDKYGQSLMSRDQRDELVDAMQEMGDLLQYAMSCRINKRDMSPIRTLIPILSALCTKHSKHKRETSWCGFF